MKSFSATLSFLLALHSATSFMIAPSSVSKKKPYLTSSLSVLMDDETSDYAKIPRRGGRRQRSYDEGLDGVDYDELYDRVYDDEEDWDDEDEDEDEYGLFSDVLIDNPILDSIDPDGAAERFPELARDPRFWFDMVLFIAFLNYLSFVGPQNFTLDFP